jgi:translation initiation factor 1
MNPGKKPKPGSTDDLSQPVYSTDKGDLRKAGLGGSLGHLLKPTAPPAAKKNAETGTRKLTVRLERKGRGGKTVTLVEHYQPASGRPSLADLARDLKAHCGTGGSLEDNTILIQGDQRPRVAAYLRQLGLDPSVSGS